MGPPHRVQPLADAEMTRQVYLCRLRDRPAFVGPQLPACPIQQLQIIGTGELTISSDSSNGLSQSARVSLFPSSAGEHFSRKLCFAIGTLRSCRQTVSE